MSNKRPPLRYSGNPVMSSVSVRTSPAACCKWDNQRYYLLWKLMFSAFVPPDTYTYIIRSIGTIFSVARLDRLSHIEAKPT